MTTAPPNHRASLLSGLRTGGVRSTSSSIPHTAAPGVTFNVPRFASHHHNSSPFPEDEEDQLAEIPHHNIYAAHGARAIPVTAAVDGPNNRFSAQQQQQVPRGMNPNSVPFSPAAFNPNMVPQSAQIQNQAQALQMQMLQLEVMRIQNIQAQQMQAEMLAQAQRQQQAQVQSQRRASLGFNPPATAGPLTGSFDLRSAALSAQIRRANQADQMRAQLGVGGEDQLPMTAALGGKFGSRTASLNVPGAVSRYAVEEYDETPLPPPTPGSTTVISGGTSLGNPASNNLNSVAKAVAAPAVSSKSDSATSWRRGGNNNSVLSGNNRAVSSPSVKVTPPSDTQRSSPPLPSSASVPKFRPRPLHFSGAAAQAMPAITIDTSDSNDHDDGSGSSSSTVDSNSSPTTPRSSSSNETPLSPREEAAKKLYEGLGIGRPASAVSIESHHSQVQAQQPSAVFHRIVSQPTRQPRGPPSGADELGPKNFATRIRRKAIGGLGVLMDARERRELVEAF
ncbi:hypothetical protein DXG03_003458 [Asterophora parasitica]|uniref:Uncharacterized protein n=1 Tax=Asterophora parasitica TaxID=117018 RepID=A0A9P7KDC5_9AGAR|nr:hypothetical protein DXG03_003458 [Asterophora parasitica]